MHNPGGSRRGSAEPRLDAHQSKMVAGSALIREGCDEMQGYLVGRPHPIAAYAEVVGGDQRRQKTLVRNSAL
jgi:hypothetical protein